MKTRLISFRYIFILVFSSINILLAAENSVTVGVLSDNISKTEAVIIQQFEHELSLLVQGEFVVKFPKSKQFKGNFSIPLIKKHYQAMQNDPNIDIILTVGLLASEVAQQSKIRQKPTFAPFVFDMNTSKINQSGIKNFSFLTLDANFEEELKRFIKITAFTHLCVLIDETLYQHFPDAIKSIEKDAKDAKLKITFIRSKSLSDDLLENIPADSDAVMIAALPQLDSTAKKRLIKGLIDKKLPSYTLSPEISVEEGILASSSKGDQFNRRIRRLALNVQAVLRGARASAQPILLKEKHKLLINMQTARAIGVHPDFLLLQEAKLLHEESQNNTVLTLEQIAKEAVEHNLGIIAGKLGVDAGKETVNEVRSVLYPTLTGNISYTELNDNNVYVENGFYAQKSTSGVLSLQQILFSEKALANLEIQKKLQIARQAQQKALELEVVKQAATLFLNILVTQTYTEIAKDNLLLTQRNLEFAKSRVNSGASDLSDLYHWQSQISTTRRNLLTTKANLAKAKDLLKRILHRPLDVEILFEPINLEALHKMISHETLIKEVANEQGYTNMTYFFITEGLIKAPELQSANAQLEAQKRQLLSNQRSYWAPDVVLAGEVSHIFDETRSSLSSFALEDETNWQAGISISLPLYEGGAKTARKNRTQLQLQQLKVQYQRQIEQIKEGIRGDMHAMRASYPAIALSKEAATAAQKSFELIRANYAKGSRSMTDLLIAQNAKLLADSAAANAIYQFLIDFTQLQRDIGSFDFFLDSKGYDTLIHRLETALKNSKEKTL